MTAYVKTKKGRRPRGNPLHKKFAADGAVMVKDGARIGINIKTLAECVKQGWRRVN